MEIQQMMQMMLQNKMTEAQINNLNADTKGKEINNRVIPFKRILSQAGIEIGSGECNIFCP